MNRRDPQRRRLRNKIIKANGLPNKKIQSSLSTINCVNLTHSFQNQLNFILKSHFHLSLTKLVDMSRDVYYYEKCEIFKIKSI